MTPMVLSTFPFSSSLPPSPSPTPSLCACCSFHGTLEWMERRKDELQPKMKNFEDAHLSQKPDIASCRCRSLPARIPLCQWRIFSRSLQPVGYRCSSPRPLTPSTAIASRDFGPNLTFGPKVMAILRTPQRRSHGHLTRSYGPMTRSCGPVTGP